MSIQERKKISLFELVTLSMLGAFMFVSDIAMEALPNIHLVAMLIVLYTALFRYKALISIYIYVMITGVFYGFALWWIAYLYIWLFPFFLALLIPKRAPRWLKVIFYPVITMLHGLLFGVLYAPAQALIYGLDFDGMLAWIAAGMVFDIIHAVGNFTLGLLVHPLEISIRKILKRMNKA